MSRRRTLKLKWFELGTRAVRRHHPQAPGYACPLCLGAVENLDFFTFEDVPPASVGGRPLLLTCRKCNSAAGHELDVHVKKAHLTRQFLMGEEIKEAKDFQIRTDSGSMPIRLRSNEKGFTLIGHEKAGIPKEKEALLEQFKRASETDSWKDMTLHLDFPTYSPRRENVGWLRAAYLAAFAKLGYGYILRPHLDVVREQINRPNEELIPVFTFGQPGSTSKEREMALIVEPADMSSIHVRFGQVRVFLPQSHPEDDIYQRLQRISTTDSVPIKGKTLNWPKGPEFLMDFWDAPT